MKRKLLVVVVLLVALYAWLGSKAETVRTNDEVYATHD